MGEGQHLAGDVGSIISIISKEPLYFASFSLERTLKPFLSGSGVEGDVFLFTDKNYFGYTISKGKALEKSTVFGQDRLGKYGTLEDGIRQLRNLVEENEAERRPTLVQLMFAEEPVRQKLEPSFANMGLSLATSHNLTYNSNSMTLYRYSTKK